MPIYRVTYKSDQWNVKGYIGFPNGYRLNAHELDELAWEHVDEDPPLIGKVTGEGDSRATDGELDILAARLPALIYCRGGIGRVGAVKLDWIRLFADFGYVVFAPCYRGSEGGEGRDEFGGGDREDVFAAYQLLKDLPYVQAECISVLGFSRGAINAALTARTMVDVYRLVVWGGVSDLAKTYEQRVDLRRMLKRIIGGSPDKVPEAYAARSPTHMVDDIHCPTLIVHGTCDVQVDVSHGLALYEAFRQRGHNTEIHCYQGYGHHLPSPVHEAVVERMFEWLH